MTDPKGGDRDQDAGEGVPDSDPRHLDPAGDIADLFESGEIDVDLRTFLDAAESGSLGRLIPGSRRPSEWRGRSWKTPRTPTTGSS